MHRDGQGFLNQMECSSGERISACYQCYRCTIGCPVAGRMDILPHQLMRYVILGDRERVLGSETIWVCIQCMTCSVRCPNGIDVAHVIEGLRRLAAEEHGEAGRDSWEFDKSFLDSVRRRGRLSEMEAILRYKWKRGRFLDDMRMGAGMMLKKRMGIFPHSIRNRRHLKEIFKRNTR